MRASLRRFTVDCQIQITLKFSLLLYFNLSVWDNLELRGQIIFVLVLQQQSFTYNVDIMKGKYLTGLVRETSK